MGWLIRGSRMLGRHPDYTTDYLLVIGCVLELNGQAV